MYHASWIPASRSPRVTLVPLDVLPLGSFDSRGTLDARSERERGGYSTEQARLPILPVLPIWFPGHPLSPRVENSQRGVCEPPRSTRLDWRGAGWALWTQNMDRHPMRTKAVIVLLYTPSMAGLRRPGTWIVERTSQIPPRVVSRRVAFPITVRHVRSGKLGCRDGGSIGYS